MTTPTDKLVASEFWRRVEKSEGCWLWTGARSNGYGSLSVQGKVKRATHVSIWLHTDQWPSAGKVVCHHCDNPPCVNPDHLFVGTVAENNADRHRKGRSVIPVPSAEVKARGSRHGSAKLSEADVLEIRQSPLNQYQLAAKYGVSQPAISYARRGTCWAHVKEKANV